MPPRSSLRKRKAVEEPEAVAEVAAPEKKRKGAKAKVEESKVEEVESVEEPEGEKLPEDANETIYINNLNEDVKVEVLRETLKGLFSGYGPVLSVQAHANVRMRGQAFVALPDKRQAAKAVKEVAGFPLYGKPMQLAFAKSKSISVLEKQDPENVEERKKELKMHQYKQRRGSKLRRNELAAKIAEKRAAAGELDPTTAGALPGASKRQEIAMPDEYLPPNKLLFVQNLPEGTSREDIEALFSSLSNFNDVRSVPGNTKIAFVEFADIPSSSAARESLNGHTFPSGEKIKITFAR